MTQTGARPARSTGGIQSLERASAILDAVADCPEGIGLTEISHRVGLHSSTAFHLVKTMLKLGYLTQDAEAKKYRIGTKLFALASGAMRERTLVTIGAPILQELSAETGETSHLAVLSRTEVLVVARMQGAGMLQMSERVGIARPIHATALGKVLLAFLPDRARDELIASLSLPPVTRNTITDRERLRAEAVRIRSEGVAHDRGEFDADLRCLAMPVHDFSGSCIAAVGLSAPVWRLTEDAVERRARQLRGAADRLSLGLGCRPRPVAAEG